MSRFERDFFARDPLDVAPDLLGAHVVHRTERGDRIGRIVELEVYRGEEDLACHASKGRTQRTDVMYGPPGHAYVYLIYGMYDMLNVVTWPVDRPSALLVRAVEPIAGIEGRTDGPGRLTRAMGIDRGHNREDLIGDRLFLTPGTAPDAIETTARIGIDYAGAWASRPWRFTDAHSPHVSKRPRPAG